MSSQNKVHDGFETKDMREARPEANELVKIEKILRRAKEIHHERGGLLGYDLEAWLEAWDELARDWGRDGMVPDRPEHSQ